MKFIYLTIGFFAFVLGCAGIVLPVLPTTPFLLLAAVCFTRGSRRVDQWFRQTKVYKNHLEGFVNNREMEGKTKVVILTFASIFLLIAFFMMENSISVRRMVTRCSRFMSISFCGRVIQCSFLA